MMHAPGVEVRPLRQITGEAEFNEVYLTDVRIPDSDRIGEVGDGWRVSMTTLMNERVTIGGGGGGSGGPKRASGAIAEAVDLWKKRTEHDPATSRPAHEALDRRRGAPPHQHARRREGEVGEPRTRGLDRQARDRAQPAAHLRAVHEPARRRCPRRFRLHVPAPRRQITLTAALGEARHMFLRARANSIEGGTSEIMRNILGERILGLPGEPRVDKELP